ncbi:hypothetical protein HYPSUDRAFT_39491 [Hypholoma sublateritium FD-334 SS-4]|uniref:Cytochrome P450 n=1 Tax=Hypholoma sublateritium (strain FD-334 SS-4) TaxID=945553 RepID=A0A0D2PWW3_HYPSF|nr:hypothetical protein HYPSUDRAFT_39491 [Hypholoma sublateritium FD-334 SS-4]
MLQDIVQAGLDRPILSIGVISVCYWVVLYHFTGETRKLQHVPTLGHQAPFLSVISAIYFVLNGQKTIAAGLKKWPNSVFKVSDITNWLLLTGNPKIVEEIRKAPENVLSSMIAIDESLQVNYTLGENVSSKPYHIPIVRAQLTRALPELVPEVIDEIQQAFGDVIPPTEDWTSVKVLDNTMKIVSRASNRIFVGLPLCRNPDYLKLNIQFTIDVVQTGAILRITPVFLRPILNYLISNVPDRIKAGMKHLVPLIQARRAANESHAAKPVDMLTWLMDGADEEESSDRNLTLRMMTINFAAIHTSSTTFAHTLYYLATYPKYLRPLREEIEDALSEEGWSKAGLDRMVSLDSFIKEVQRLRPLGCLGMTRVAVRDHKFSDGTFVPRGTTVGVAIEAAHMNSAVYEDPETFDPFRFVKMKERDTSKKFDIVSTSCDSLVFGHGIHACPGRYFAASELKLMLAHLVVNYDVRLENEGVRPADMWVATSRVPNPTAEVLFRKRKVA